MLDNLLLGLNLEQKDIVLNAQGPCLVLAGAGSGKTKVITHRVGYLIGYKKVDIDSVLLLTFTNKAANEMIARSQKILKNDFKLPWAGTFHHLAYKILKKQAKKIGYKNDFQILDQADAKSLLKNLLKDFNLNNNRFFPKPEVLLSIFNLTKNTLSDLESKIFTQYNVYLDFLNEIKELYNVYQEFKLKNNLMDFSDLLFNLYQLLYSNPDVKKKYQDQFAYIMVDEYQDTNKLQIEIIDLFLNKNKNLLVVGDDAQSIYSFRGADVNNILEFQNKYPQAKIFYLRTNYRSSQEILDLANEVISFNVKQYNKKLVAKNNQNNDTKPQLNSFYTQKEEAEFIIEQIKYLHDVEDINFSEMAVLFRAGFHAQNLEILLIKNNIDYEIRGGKRFFERAHIKDVLSYLRLIVNPNDIISLQRVLSLEKGLGQKTIQKIINNLNLGYQNISSILTAKAKIGWNNFLNIFNSFKQTNQQPQELLLTILQSPYKQYLKSQYLDYEDRLEDIKQLLSFAKQSSSLGDFLAEMSLQTELFSFSDDNNQDKLVLSTIHQAKGLEWQVVFIINLINGHFPNSRALKEKNGLEEERRLFYVAVTRAKKYLFLSYSQTGRFGDFDSKPSLFLEEIRHKNLFFANDQNNINVFDNKWSELNDEESGLTYEPINEESRSFLKNIDEL